MDATTNFRTSESKLDYEYTRLHITPLNPALLSSILPPTVLSVARNISYHSLQTFPEKDFGFVDLPSMEAQKIKKKLNGSILKGTKVKIEEARPAKRKLREEDTTLAPPEAGMNKLEISSKKRKRDPETLPAIELKDRKVKRGWTDPVPAKKLDKKSKRKKDVVRSKYTSGPECLFRTTLPANVPAAAKDGVVAANAKTERRKKKKQAKDVVIHEFSKVTKHATFLRSSGVLSTVKGVAEYVEGKGWVDAAGNVVEAVIAMPKKATSNKTEGTQSSTDSSSSSESGDNSEGGRTTEEVKKEPVKAAKQAVVENLTSSSGTSSAEDDGIDGDASSSSQSTEGESSKSDEETDPTALSPKTPISLKIDIPKTESMAAPKIHPLEELFKRRRPDFEAPKIPDATPSFSFFDNDPSDADEESSMTPIPMTPFTKQDFALRGLRSAAPTPDTAFPGKNYAVWPTDNVSSSMSNLNTNLREERTGDDTEGDVTPTLGGKMKKKETGKVEEKADPVTDFQKWFYEHRGEVNRGWKRRRKVVAKQRRQRENRRRNAKDA